MKKTASAPTAVPTATKFWFSRKAACSARPAPIPNAAEQAKGADSIMTSGSHDARAHEAGGGRGEEQRPCPASSALSEKQRRELWRYIAASIAAVELVAAVVAVIYGFMRSGPGARDFAFPWLHWAAMAAIIPSLLLLLVHLADVGLFGARAASGADEEWQRHLPERLQRLYRIARSAPAAVILLGVIILGAGIMTIDGALGLLITAAAALKPHIPAIAAAAAAAVSVISLAVVWLHYRTRKLIAEYRFRSEVLEKTGVIIVDKGSVALPPGAVSDVPYSLVGATAQAGELACLPAADGSGEPGAQEKNAAAASRRDGEASVRE
jgi:hypothetical protein